MHEFAIGECIVETVRDEMGRLEPEPHLVRAYVVAGGLHQIVPDYLSTAYEVLTRGTLMEGSELVLEVRPVAGRCRCCAWEGEITPPFFQCGRCEALDIEMTAGTELYLERLEVEES